MTNNENKKTRLVCVGIILGAVLRVHGTVREGVQTTEMVTHDDAGFTAALNERHTYDETGFKARQTSPSLQDKCGEFEFSKIRSKR